MKYWVIWCLSLMVMMARAEITVSNLVVTQQEGTKLMDINFDLHTDTTNGWADVSLFVANGVSAINTTNLSGDHGLSVQVGAGKQIVWDMGTDWNDNVATLDFALTVNDGVSALWRAQAGMSQLETMLQGVRVPFEDAFQCEYNPTNQTYYWSSLFETNDVWHGAKVEVQSIRNPFSGSFEYDVTSSFPPVKPLGGSQAIVRGRLIFNPITRYLMVGYSSDNIWFTRYDNFYGEIYLGQSLKLDDGGGGQLPTFADEVNVVGSGVYYGSQYSEDMATLLSLTCYNGYEQVFQQGLALNAYPIDTANLFNNNAMDRIYEMSGEAGGVRLDSRVSEILIDGGNIWYVDPDNPGAFLTNYSVKAVYAPGNITIGGFVDGEMNIAVNGTTYIHKDGIVYESAPVDLDVRFWTPSQIENIDDVFCLVSRDAIRLEGDNVNDTDINLHGAYMSINYGFRTVLYQTQSPKRHFRLFGSVITKEMYPPGDGSNGYGFQWLEDPRAVAPSIFPHDFYTLYVWSNEVND